MTRRVISVEVDGPTARLLALATGAQQAEMLPVASGRVLVGLARGIRSLCAAREHALALVIVSDLDTFAKGAEEESPALAQVLTRHAEGLRKTLAAQV